MLTWSLEKVTKNYTVINKLKLNLMDTTEKFQVVNHTPGYSKKQTNNPDQTTTITKNQ